MKEINESQELKTDFVLPFQLDTSLLRGRLVKLEGALNEILSRHSYPTSVANLLAEATAIAVALGTSLKYDGIFTLQIKSDGAVNLLVTDITSYGGIRACAKFDPEKIKDQTTPLLGKGHLAFTADQQTSNERYQGVVNLEGEGIAEAVQHYFKQSEQIPTGIIAAAKQDEQGNWTAGCLMLQRMPSEGGITTPTDTSKEDDWLRAMMFMRTCTSEELTSPDLQGETLLCRLFNEEGVIAYDKKPLRHQCRCSKERILSFLNSMPPAEIYDLAIEDKITVTCEFCSTEYIFDKTLFSSPLAGEDRKP